MGWQPQALSGWGMVFSRKTGRKFQYNGKMYERYPQTIIITGNAWFGDG